MPPRGRRCPHLIPPSALTRRGFSCLVPTAKLVGDTTYRRTTAGFIYLTVAHDLCTHMVVG
jgi:putative transposase